ncbi:hypothetical protein [Sulfobacillus thermosulfidooxidans]|uniref:hypothetical protein n=1 Tax=Sulfobacillus thermosulfidooxidans TaxID=28034 RepID=UPI000ACD617A|nr:hypothetical protein [Sulfobacillus thermosulfidooxidans]
MALVQLRRITEDPAWRYAVTQDPPFGPGGTLADCNGGDALEIWGSTWDDSEDWVEFRVMAGTTVIRSWRFSGF